MAYSPTLGRWVSQDPAGYVDGMSLYEYVRSSPVNYLDPLGQAAVGAIAFPALPVVAAGKVYFDKHPFGTDDLTAAEQVQLDKFLKQLVNCAAGCGDKAVSDYLNTLDIRTKFEDKGSKEDNADSETRSRLTGTITILSNDFFKRDRCSQLESLLHEAYHSGSQDFTETVSYNWASKAMDRMKSCLGCKR